MWYWADKKEDFGAKDILAGIGAIWLFYGTVLSAMMGKIGFPEKPLNVPEPALLLWCIGTFFAISFLALAAFHVAFSLRAKSLSMWLHFASFGLLGLHLTLDVLVIRFVGETLSDWAPSPPLQ